MCLWRWYLNITITILDIIHRPVFYLKHDVLETGLSSPSGGTYSAEAGTSSFYWAQLSMFHLKTETESSVLNKRQDDG
jgi:hypothetical protein